MSLGPETGRQLQQSNPRRSAHSLLTAHVCLVFAANRPITRHSSELSKSEKKKKSMNMLFLTGNRGWCAGGLWVRICTVVKMDFCSFFSTFFHVCFFISLHYLLIRVPNSSLMAFWMFSVQSQLHCFSISRHRMFRATSASAVSDAAKHTWKHSSLLYTTRYELYHSNDWDPD